MMKRKGALSVNKAFSFMIASFVIIILAFQFYFPTLNSASALNNSTTLWLAGTNYDWVAPVVVILSAVAIIVLLYKGIGIGKA